MNYICDNKKKWHKKQKTTYLVKGLTIQIYQLSKNDEKKLIVKMNDHFFILIFLIVK